MVCLRSISLAVLCLGITAIPRATHGQSDSRPIGASHARAGSPRARDVAVPVDVQAQLKAVAKKLRPSLMLVGTRGGATGSGFLISKQHRLVATAAHVADYAIQSGLNVQATAAGTSNVYRVERIWYHPRIVRKLDETMYARSDSPDDGPVDLGTTDVAVLQLADEGLALPDPCELADDAELEHLEGKPMGLLGFVPGFPPAWLGVRNGPEPALVIGRVSGIGNGSANRAAAHQNPWVLHWSAIGPGSSGGPLFLPNGHVFAIISTGSPDHDEEDCSYRIDALRELLEYHGLGRMAGNRGREPQARPDWGADPNLGRYRRAVALIRKARDYRERRLLATAGVLCNEAIQLVPDYAGAFLERGWCHLAYCGNYWSRLSPAQRERHADRAHSDISRCIELWKGLPEAYPALAQSVVYLDYSSGDESEFLVSVAYMTRLLKQPIFNAHERAHITNCRAQCQLFRKEFVAAREDYDESIRLDPEEPRWYLNRAIYWEFRKQPDRAAADRQSASELIKQRADQSK